ncbi:MAG: transporter substrate-binding domain-containing protein [Proteobacteria bacterium]|nr:transporter substrate-binding domain-containing protein [Pseudomonadota bacterium]MBU1596736.1 transporter substrate-binding domain-containing protein [Pseudomonadota bacterium]
MNANGLPLAARTPGLRLALLLACLLLCLPAPAPAAQTLVLNTDDSSPMARPDGSGIADRIVAEAFRRIGVPVRLVILPSERCLLNANAGIDDGNYDRAAGVERQYPNLVLVPEPMGTFPFTAFTRDPGLKLSGWADLRSREVAYVHGWKVVERNLGLLGKATKMRDEEAVLAMVAGGRAAVGIANLYTGQEIIRRKGYQGTRAVLPPLADPPMHIYLHKRHAELVPRLAEALRQMRREGVIERLTRTGLEEAQP